MARDVAERGQDGVVAAPPAGEAPLWDGVYRRLKSDIITLKVLPGQPLRESQLAAQRGEEAYRILNEADNKLHAALLEAAGNRRIQMIMDNLYIMIHRYRYLSADRVYEDSIAEHLAIIEAIKAGDREGAEAAMRRHIVRLKENVHKVL